MGYFENERRFLDMEDDEILTYTQLQNEYEELKRDGNTEAESFGQYLSNCMYYNNGTLKEI